MYKLSKRSLDELKGVHPDLVKVVKRAIEITSQDFLVTTGVRTQEEQDALYEQGRTKPGPIVTWTRNSNHLPKSDGYGYAVDLCPYPVDWDNVGKFTNIASAMLKAATELGVQMGWGGYYVKTKDYPHFELIKKGK